MKTDVNGCSTCPAGEEKIEHFYSSRWSQLASYVQYDFRRSDGKLFSTVAPTVEIARARRDAWLKELEKQ